LVIDLSIVGLLVTIFTSLYFLMWCFLSATHIVVKDRTYKTKKFNPHEPLVSVLIPCRDEEKVVAEAIRQCLHQSKHSIALTLFACAVFFAIGLFLWYSFLIGEFVS